VPDDCIFCQIVAGEIPAARVDEDEHTVAFMDLNPWTRGHALVIPREHHPDLHGIPERPTTRSRRTLATPSGSMCAPA